MTMPKHFAETNNCFFFLQKKFRKICIYKVGIKINLIQTLTDCHFSKIVAATLLF